MSGAKASRPALDRLLADCAAGHVQAVVVLKADRFSRNLGHLLTTLDQLTAQGVTFRSVTEAIDTGSTSGRAMTGMLGVFAQMERDLIFERTRSGVNAKVRAGGWGGGQEPPYGYRIAGSGRRMSSRTSPSRIVTPSMPPPAPHLHRRTPMSGSSVSGVTVGHHGRPRARSSTGCAPRVTTITRPGVHARNPASASATHARTYGGTPDAPPTVPRPRARAPLGCEREHSSSHG